MLRRRKHGPGIAAFDDLAVFHDHDAVADVVGGRQIVRDVDDGDAELVAKLLEQIDDRHAQRGVDHRHRLVRDDQLWLREQRPGDRRPLQLPAGQLMGIAPGDLRQ